MRLTGDSVFGYATYRKTHAVPNTISVRKFRNMRLFLLIGALPCYARPFVSQSRSIFNRARGKPAAPVTSHSAKELEFGSSGK